MAQVLIVDPVADDAAIDRLLDCCRRFPGYTPSGTGSIIRKSRRRQGRPTGSGPTKKRFAAELGERADSRAHYLRRGGLRSAPDDPLLPYRHRYFRETLVDGAEIYAPGVEELLDNPRLRAAAAELFGSDEVEPWTVYVNLMLPGQELGLHTDTPEFRGVTREEVPSWLLCAMALSGLFEPWRVPIATAVNFVQAPADGGAFIWYPTEGGAPQRVSPKRNTAVVMDTDSVFHAVEAVPEGDQALTCIDRHSVLVPETDGTWSLRCGTPGRLEEVARYRDHELRLSLSWKAYCHRDNRPADGSEALTLDRVLTTFVDELVGRGELPSSDHGLTDKELGLLIIRQFITFPDESL